MKSEPSSSLTFHLGYQPALDGVRGFAVLWVIGFHYNLPFGRDGLFGVDIFFVLSGFLITVLLMEEWGREGRIRLKNFYVRRVLRLYPALLVMLFVFFMVTPREYVFSTLFYFTNWIKALHLQPDSLFLDHTWSLSIEEQYYILWPIFLFILLRMRLPKVGIVLIPFFLGMVSALARIIVWNSTQDWFRVYMGTDLHADGLLIGSAFGLMTAYGLFPAYSKHKYSISLLTLLVCLLAIWLLVEKQFTQSFIPLYGNLGVALGTIVLISRLVNYPSPILINIFSFPPLVKIGVISYGLYLWHAPVGAIIDRIDLSLNPALLIGTKILITFLAAVLSYWLVEKPFLRLKNKLLAYRTCKKT